MYLIHHRSDMILWRANALEELPGFACMGHNVSLVRCRCDHDVPTNPETIKGVLSESWVGRNNFSWYTCSDTTKSLYHSTYHSFILKSVIAFAVHFLQCLFLNCGHRWYHVGYYRCTTRTLLSHMSTPYRLSHNYSTLKQRKR